MGLDQASLIVSKALVSLGKRLDPDGDSWRSKRDLTKSQKVLKARLNCPKSVMCARAHTEASSSAMLHMVLLSSKKVILGIAI
jgi:hypothetical protein